MRKIFIKFAAILVISLMSGNIFAIDTKKAVGEIPMTSGVSSTGAVTYTVPIEVYPGINGMQPQLAISYNSHAGNGIMGAGWNISGLSSITRGNKRIYYDDITQGIRMNKDDAFFLDGMRLIELSSNTTQTKYQSEQGNIKATAYLSGNTVLYFKVFFPNGTYGTFGYLNNSVNRIEYPLTLFSDLYDNAITYNYTYTENHYRINSISYANASVVFDYDSSNRPDIISGYLGGLEITENKLLKKITCKFGSAVLRNYEFTYIYRDKQNVSFLEEIGYSANNQYLNPIKFHYGEDNNTIGFNTNETTLSYNLPFKILDGIKKIIGKFDYRSDDDGLIVFEPKNQYRFYSDAQTYRFENNYSGNEDIFLFTELNNSVVSPMSFKTESGFINVLCANLDGIYDEEVIKINNIVSGNYDKIIFKTFQTDVNTKISLKYTREYNLSTVITSPSGNKSVHPKYYYTGDFLGNGKMQVLAVSSHNPIQNINNPTKVYLFDLESASTNPLYTGQPFSFSIKYSETNLSGGNIETKNSDRLYIVDYDGDGKSDICLINSTGTYIYNFVKSGSTDTIQLVSTYTGLKISDLDGKLLMPGEFNGDGKTDFLLSPKVNDSDWFVYYSKGNGDFNKKSVTIEKRLGIYNYILQDVNSDGLTDLIKQHPIAVLTFRATGNGFTSLESGIGLDPEDPLILPILIPVNICNHYNPSQLIILEKDKIFKYSYKRDDTKEKLLTKSITSFGVIDNNYYHKLLKTDNFYVMDKNFDFPYCIYQGPQYITERREKCLNNTIIEDINYKYENAVIHKQGLGFSGFEKFTETDILRTRTKYQKFNPLKYSVLIEEDSPTANITYKYTFVEPTNRITKVLAERMTIVDKLKNTKDSTEFSNYDVYGNPGTITVKYGDGIVTETITNTYWNNNIDTEGYLLGFLSSTLKTTSSNNECWKEYYQVVSHDNKGKPTNVKMHVSDNSGNVIWNENNQVSQEFLLYYGTGNIHTYSVKNYKSTKIFETICEYNNFGRLSKQIENPMGYETSYIYNTLNGTLSKIINHKNIGNDLETTFGYDDFFRNISVTYPDGRKNSYEYLWEVKGINGLYCIKNKESHTVSNVPRLDLYTKPIIKIYFDALNRETSSSVVNFDNSESTTENQYYTNGLLWKVSLPYNGSASLWNTYYYDEYDRPLSIIEASGRITSYDYIDVEKKVTITKEAIASTYKYDNQGNLISVADPAGTITYNMRPDGQPNTIIAPGNVTTSFDYDNYGRRTSITDPSAGIQSWSYDIHGNVVTETDANNKTTTYGYDNFNRLETITRPTPELKTTYCYNADGLLISESATTGGTTVTSTTFTYDNFGRLATETETVPDNKWLKKTCSYSEGKLYSTKYTIQNNVDVITEIYTYQNGHLVDIKLNNNSNTSIWNLNSENNFGQPTEVTTGNYNRIYGYSEYGLPTDRSASYSGTTFMNHTYNFNPLTGNLNYRKDNIRNKQENFGYDSMNRLTSFGSNTVTYDNAKGNLTSKTDIGSFRYQTPNKPYAISGITTVPVAIPITEQIITYISFKKPATITEGIYNATFTYNGSNGRVKMEVKSGIISELTRYYISDCYEFDTKANVKPANTKEKLYLGGDFYTAPAVYVRENSGEWQLYFIFRDYLGSIMHIRRHDNNSNYNHEYSYDAWGRLRNPANHTVFGPDSQPDLFLGRGYTGHEHLPWFGLINMNARLYDPAVGRFLSPDPIIQDVTNSQNYNRYSYCINNPLKYKDPSGMTMLQYYMSQNYQDGGGFWYRGEYFVYDSSAGGGQGGFVNTGCWGGRTGTVYHSTTYSQTTDYYTYYLDNGTWVQSHYIRSETKYWTEWTPNNREQITPSKLPGGIELVSYFFKGTGGRKGNPSHQVNIDDFLNFSLGIRHSLTKIWSKIINIANGVAKTINTTDNTINMIKEVNTPNIPTTPNVPDVHPDSVLWTGEYSPNYEILDNGSIRLNEALSIRNGFPGVIGDSVNYLPGSIHKPKK